MNSERRHKRLALWSGIVLLLGLGAVFGFWQLRDEKPPTPVTLIPPLVIEREPTPVPTTVPVRTPAVRPKAVPLAPKPRLVSTPTPVPVPVVVAPAPAVESVVETTTTTTTVPPTTTTTATTAPAPPPPPYTYEKQPEPYPTINGQKPHCKVQYRNSDGQDWWATYGAVPGTTGNQAECEAYGQESANSHGWMYLQAKWGY